MLLYSYINILGCSPAPFAPFYIQQVVAASYIYCIF